MQVWEHQLEQMLDEVADSVGDWDELMNALAVQPPSQKLHQYLEARLPHFKRMNRQMNRVEYKPGKDGEPSMFLIHNYDYKTWDWAVSCFDHAIVTANLIALDADKLTPEIREKLRKRISV